MLHISILTLFPEMFVSPFASSIIKRAIDTKTVDITYINIRDFSEDRYKSVDDHPYGGGQGMIMRVDVIDRALIETKKRYQSHATKTVLLDPQGKQYCEKDARALCRVDHLILLCGHYEGVDERVRSLVDEEFSIGDYILTGGEIPAMVIVDSVVRLLPTTLKKREATIDESFSQPLLEYPQYTRPEVYNGKKVPQILLSGDHAKIADWRAHQAQQRTFIRRPDLIAQQGRLRRK